jgi:hypothetical protein
VITWLSGCEQAHFVAPNTSAHIRYAVYFRVHKAGAPRHQQEAILNPWLRWVDSVSSSSVSSNSSSSIGSTGEGSGQSRSAWATATDGTATAAQLPSNETKQNRLPCSPLAPICGRGSDASAAAAVADVARDVAATIEGLSPGQAAKVATLVTMAAEMGLGKSETELVAALEQNGWDENRAIGSLF